ncbi:hypothetical protein Tco_0884583 [Tanacetum coccineum]
MTPTSSPSYEFLDDSSNVISNIIRSSPVSNINPEPVTVDTHTGLSNTFLGPIATEFDDIVLIASSENLLQRLLLLCIRRMFLSQRKYTTEILDQAHMVGCNSEIIQSLLKTQYMDFRSMEEKS